MPNPFDADASVPFAVTGVGLGTLERKARKDLRALLPLRMPSEGRVKLATPSLERVGGHAALVEELERDGTWYVPELQRHHVVNNDGLVVLGATAQVLRLWATRLIALDSRSYKGMSYDELTWPETTGEVQVFRDFDQRVSAAVSAREQLFPGQPQRKLAPDEQQAVWDLGTLIREQRRQHP